MKYVFQVNTMVEINAENVAHAYAEIKKMRMIGEGVRACRIGPHDREFIRSRRLVIGKKTMFITRASG